MSQPKSRIPVTTVLAIFGLSVAAGCATNPATGQSQLALVSEGQEIAMGRQNDTAIVREMGLVADQNVPDWQHPRAIVHLMSADLRKWTYVSTLELSADRVIDPCVAQLWGGGWRMWYLSGLAWERDGAGLRHRYHIKYAASADGIHWQRDGTVCIDFRDASEYAISRPSVNGCWRSSIHRCVRRRSRRYTRRRGRPEDRGSEQGVAGSPRPAIIRGP